MRLLVALVSNSIWSGSLWLQSAVSATLVWGWARKAVRPKIFWVWETWGKIHEKNHILLAYLTCPVPVGLRIYKELSHEQTSWGGFMGLSSAAREIKQGALSPELVSDKVWWGLFYNFFSAEVFFFYELKNKTWCIKFQVLIFSQKFYLLKVFHRLNLAKLWRKFSWRFYIPLLGYQHEQV